MIAAIQQDLSVVLQVLHVCGFHRLEGFVFGPADVVLVKVSYVVQEFLDITSWEVSVVTVDAFLGHLGDVVIVVDPLIIAKIRFER